MLAYSKLQKAAELLLFKNAQTLENLHKTYVEKSKQLLKELQKTAVANENLFEKLMEVTKYCSLGQITEALFGVGGQYRRNM